MFRRLSLPSLAIAVACLPTIGFAQTTKEGDEQSRLISVLESEATTFDKAKACQRLAVVGDKAAVPTLATLLPDEKLSDYARTALQRIPDPSAGSALRLALLNVEGDQLVGVIHSLGQRRDQQAVPKLIELLDGEDAAVFAAAARALGAIGNQQAATSLRAKFVTGDKEQKTVLADALLQCGQRNPKRTIEFFDLVRLADVPDHLRLAATYDAIVARGEDGKDLLGESLDADDDATFRMALQAARALGAEATPMLLDRFEKQKPDRQALLLIEFGELADERCLAAVRQAAGSDNEEVRVQALRALPAFGGADAAALLIDAAVHGEGRVAEAARSALVDVEGETVDFQIIRLLGDDEPRTVAAAVDLAARRHVSAATRRLLKLATDSDEEIRLTALRAAGETVSMDDFGELLDRTLAATKPAEVEAANAALESACRRLPQDAAARQIEQAMAKASTDQKTQLLPQLAYLGGPEALEVVAATARSKDDALVDAATRVLGEWLTADAAAPLLELAKSSTANKYKVRTLRGALRIARQLDMPLDGRMQVCRQALALAQRDDERILVLDVLSRYPAVDGLALAQSLLDNGKLRERGCNTILAVAERLDDKHRSAIESALTTVIETTKRKALIDRARQRIETLRTKQP